MSGSPKSWRGIIQCILVGMGQVRSPSASTQRVDADGLVV